MIQKHFSFNLIRGRIYNKKNWALGINWFFIKSYGTESHMSFWYLCLPNSFTQLWKMTIYNIYPKSCDGGVKFHQIPCSLCYSGHSIPSLIIGGGCSAVLHALVEPPHGQPNLSYKSRVSELDHAYTPAHLFIRCHSVICAMTVVDLAFPFLPIKILPDS